jgi:hypothetical protein
MSPPGSCTTGRDTAPLDEELKRKNKEKRRLCPREQRDTKVVGPTRRERETQREKESLPLSVFQMFFQPAVGVGGGHTTRWQEIIGRCTFHIINP